MHEMSVKEADRLAGRRVIIITGVLGLGGAERQALLLARHLKDGGADVQWWGLTDTPGRACELCDACGIPWKALPFDLTWNRREMVGQVVRFTAALRRVRPDVLLPYTNPPNVFCGLAWRWAGAKTCLWSQRDEGNIGRLPGRLERLAARRAAGLIANSTGAADFLVRDLSVERTRIRLIHNGVELAAPQRSVAQWRSDLGVGPSTRLACMVANLTEFKDHETLLCAWRRVQEGLGAGREAVLLLAGKPYTTTERLKALAFDLELGRSVRFLGAVADIGGLLAAVDLGILSSRLEASPNGLLECMAAGLPVVGTDIAGIREAVGTEQIGCLAPPGDAEALGRAILAALGDETGRRQAGEANRRRIEREFSVEAMVTQTVRYIADTLRGEPG